MAFERPTFHESWYRVEAMRPRLRSTVQISRQHFRGQGWHVVQDHTNNAFFRLSDPAYTFLGMLDGNRTIGQAWNTCMETLGDDAPTQGEVIQLLGQLYTSNLLQGEVAADTTGLFNRFKKRRNREIQNYLMNLMFIRLPLLDPDRFLNKWLPLLGWIFSWVGLAVWAVLIGIGLYFISGVPDWTTKIASGGKDLLNPDNLVLLYVAFAGIKACHEFGHAISCKKFGRQQGSGGEVHVMGIMFLIFSPVPYVDASSSWALTSKWKRAIVGAAGMWVELAIASIAAVVWAQTDPNSAMHQFAYNIMFVAGFSTIVFNANPLLRYDGYYILSDLIEIPNLAQRSKELVYFLVKRYIWGVKQARNPSHTTGEAWWLFVYSIAAFIMRVVVTVGIMLYLTNVLEGPMVVLAAAMGVASLVTWIAVPIGKFVHYLATSPELFRVRPRAIATSFLGVAAIVFGVGILKIPHHARADGVVKSAAMDDVYIGADGFVTGVQAESGPLDPVYGVPVVKKDGTLVTAANKQLNFQLAEQQAKLAGLEQHYWMALADKDQSAAQAYKAQEEDPQSQIKRLEKQLADLTLTSPRSGLLVSPKLERATGQYLKQATDIGFVADMDLSNMTIRAAVPQEISAPLAAEGKHRVEIRIVGRPEALLAGDFQVLPPSGDNQLADPQLGIAGGGQLAVSPDDRRGTTTVEQFFDVRVTNLQWVSKPEGVMGLLPGEQVVVRFDFADKPLAAQIWTKILQALKRF